MSIAFTDKDWSRIADTWTRWWAGALDRPILCAQRAEAVSPGRPEPNAPLLDQANCLDFTIPADDIIDRADYEMSAYKFYGDSFPFFPLTAFGPGVGAVFMGCTVDNSSGRIWFGKPKAEPPIEEIQVRIDWDHPILRRMEELIQAAHRRWGDSVMVGYPDIGGVFDIMASFVGSEELCMALYDNPKEVCRLRDEVAKAWWELMEYFHALVTPNNRGYSAWLNCYCAKMNYTTQSDFSYMVSPSMYAEFIHPELAYSWKRLAKGIYHLDGKGELPHLPKMLAENGLDAIQWVPGDGNRDETQWAEVYQAIAGAGKKIICNSLFALPAIVQQTGCPRQIAATNNNLIPPEDWKRAEEILEEFGAM